MKLPHARLARRVGEGVLYNYLIVKSHGSHPHWIACSAKVPVVDNEASSSFISHKVHNLTDIMTI